MDSSEAVLERGISRNRLFQVGKEGTDVCSKNERVIKFVQDNINMDTSDLCQDDIRKTLANFCNQLLQKWLKCHMLEMKKKFRKQHDAWLRGNITFGSLPGSTISAGRPKKRFEDCIDSVKRRKVRHLVESKSSEELCLASRMSVRLKGQRDAAEIIKQVTCFSPKRATKLKKSFVEVRRPIPMTGDEALALFVDNKMTKRQYTAIRRNAKIRNANIYPSYDTILAAKKQCYPNNINVTETSAEVNLQDLVNHTIKRLIVVQHEVLAQIDATNLRIIFKWGADGAAGHSRYKQRFENEDDDDSFLFSVSLVPLRLTGETSDYIDKIVRQNPTTSSTKYCRPIKIIFKNESENFVKNEINRLQSQINDLDPYQIDINGKLMTCKSVFKLTMIDGKICSWLANSSGQCCHICGAKPKQMNNINDVMQRPVNESSLSFGISSLHAYIKILECILHISYRLDVKKWQIRKTDKEIVEARKKEIQEKFRKEMGLLIDIPKPGFGSSNDGNTARRVLMSPSLTSRITGVDERLIYRFSVIMKTIVSGHEMNSNHFEKFCIETAQLYADMYHWYYMPQSIHKILIHSGKLINEAILPIGQMSEEAQGARNKDAKQFREFHSRNFSRTETMEDMMHMLLITSDPVITSHRQKTCKNSDPLPIEVLNMLKNPDLGTTSQTSDSDSDTENE